MKSVSAETDFINIIYVYLTFSAQKKRKTVPDVKPDIEKLCLHGEAEVIGQLKEKIARFTLFSQHFCKDVAKTDKEE